MISALVRCPPSPQYTRYPRNPLPFRLRQQQTRARQPVSFLQACQFIKEKIQITVSELVSRFTNRSDLHQSPQYANLMKGIGWQVSGKPGSQIFFRSLGPLAIAKIQRPTELDLSALNTFRRTHHTLTTYIEPGLLTAIPAKSGFATEPFAHSCTSILDLSPDSRTILASFSQKTRYNITHSLKKAPLNLATIPLSSLTTKQQNDFFALVTTWSKAKRVAGHSIFHLQAVLDAFQDHGDLHLAYHQTKLTGALLTLYHDSVATYYAAFATQQGNQLFAPTLLTWTALTQSQRRHCDIFDFGGIYDPRYPRLYKKWLGFTKFKSTFNPTTISYPTTQLQLFW